MPGGLVRVAGVDGPVVSMQRGGRSKDAWVLWDEAVDKFSMLRPRNEPVVLQHTPAELSSRAADHLFWLGRYAERCESIARLLRCLMRQRGKVLSKAYLGEHVYELDADPDSNVIEVYINRLRKKLGKDLIQTRRGQGYVFDGAA